MYHGMPGWMRPGNFARHSGHEVGRHEEVVGNDGAATEDGATAALNVRQPIGLGTEALATNRFCKRLDDVTKPLRMLTSLAAALPSRSIQRPCYMLALKLLCSQRLACSAVALAKQQRKLPKSLQLLATPGCPRAPRGAPRGDMDIIQIPESIYVHTVTVHVHTARPHNSSVSPPHQVSPATTECAPFILTARRHAVLGFCSMILSSKRYSSE